MRGHTVVPHRRRAMVCDQRGDRVWRENTPAPDTQSIGGKLLEKRIQFKKMKGVWSIDTFLLVKS